MAQLAIRGHATRGREVIELLEMLGGKNEYKKQGSATYNYYYIGHQNRICSLPISESYRIYIVFSLEEFLEQYPYKIGDKVVNNDWDDDDIYIISAMYWEDNSVEYSIRDLDGFLHAKAWHANNLQPYKETMEDKPNLLQQLKEYFENTPREVIEKEWHEYDKYNEIGPDVEGYLEYVNNIRNPKYPKTYEECAKILDCFGSAHIDGYKNELLEKLQELLICRDAYWKIAGGWKPDWKSFDSMKYCIGTDRNVVGKCNRATGNKILAFPTEEMRDAFYENFKDLIEQCKELL